VAAQAVEHGVGTIGVARQEVPRGVQLQGDAGEHGSEAVVQVAAQPAPLLPAAADDLFAGALDRLGQGWLTP
jgi:hypothetical protein